LLVAVISDIHGNLPALRAVLEHVDGLDPQPERVWCLGDVVGYGAHPDGCAELTAARASVCLAGNHDLGVRGDIDIDYFSQSAGDAARWTREVIDEQTRSFLAALEPAGRAEEVGLYHASPRDPVWEYVLSIDQARDCFELQDDRVCLIGHTHVACFFERRDGSVRGEIAPAGTTLELDGSEWIINPGSVGQPRDGDPRAAYALLDTERWTVSFERVPYPVDEAAEAIVAAGLPVDLAQRLYVGH
jgi:diadenosine tetraphosphatase ApaH/serine/threonine PP2A family protein phosphatase